MIKFSLIFIFIFFQKNLHAEDACRATPRPDQLSVLLSEQQAVKNCYEILNDKKVFGPAIIPAEAARYCACMGDEKLVMTRKAEKEILSNKNLKDGIDSISNSIEKKSGDVLRNEILNTLSRMNKYDNLLKRGVIKEEDLTSVARCSLNNLLSEVEGLKGTKACPNSSLYDERLKMIFPEKGGVAEFKKNVSDMGNTLAKNVRSKDSCLTYQNYLEISAPASSENYQYSDFSTSTWREFKTQAEINIRKYQKSLISKENPNGKDGIWDIGKQLLNSIKSDPIFDMALQDESFFNKVKDQLNKNISIKKRNLPGIKELSDLSTDPDIVKALLDSQGARCESVATSGKLKNGGGLITGLKNSIKTFLCSPKLPPPGQFALESITDSLDKNPLNDNKGLEVYSNIAKKKAICESDFKNTKENDPYYSNVDELTSPPSDIDVHKPDTFLKDYKDFSKNYCKYVPPDCMDQVKSMGSKACSNSSYLNNIVILKQSEKCFKIYNDSPVKYTEFVTKVLDPKAVDKQLFQLAGMKWKKAEERFKGTECENFFDNIAILRQNTTSFIINRNLSMMTGVLPDKFKENPIVFLATNEGKLFYDKIKDTHDGAIIRSVSSSDTTINDSKPEGSPLFSDYFVNAKTADTSALVAFKNRTNGSEAATNNGQSTSNGSGNAEVAPVLYKRRYEDTGPRIAYGANGTQAPSTQGEPVIRTLEDLAPSVTPTSKGLAAIQEVPKPIAPDSKKDLTPTSPEKVAKEKNASSANSNQDQSSGTKSSGAKYNPNFDFHLTSGDKSSGSSHNSDGSGGGATDLEKTKKDLEAELARKQKEYADLINNGSDGNDNQLSDYDKEKKRLTDERNNLKNNKINPGPVSKRNDSRNLGNNKTANPFWSGKPPVRYCLKPGDIDGAIDENGHLTVSCPDNENKPFNGGYGRGEEFDKERAKNKLDDGSAAFDPNDPTKERSPATAGASGGTSSGGKGSSPTLSESGDGGPSGRSSVSGGKSKRSGNGSDLESDVLTKCGTGPILKCIFPNSYFVDDKIKGRLYTIIANLKLEGRKFKGLEKVRRPKKEMKMGDNNRPKYFLYTYDLIFKENGASKEVTDELRSEIFHEIKKNRKDATFKKKLVGYRYMTKVVPPKILLNDQEALDAIKLSITKDEYEALQD